MHVAEGCFVRDRLPWFWFFFTVAVLLLSAMDRYHIVSQFKQRKRVVIIDPAGTYYLSPLLQFSEAKDMHFFINTGLQPGVGQARRIETVSTVSRTTARAIPSQAVETALAACVCSPPG